MRALLLSCLGGPGAVALAVAAPSIGCSPLPAPAPPIVEVAPSASLYVPARPPDLDAHPDADAGADVPIANADVVVASLRGKFRVCYQIGLRLDPTMAGKVLIRAQVDADGRVVSSEAAWVKGLSSDVTFCLAGVVKGASFSAPGGKGSTLQIPITFEQQGK